MVISAFVSTSVVGNDFLIVADLTPKNVIAAVERTGNEFLVSMSA
jgi:hypothetical protein